MNLNITHASYVTMGIMFINVQVMLFAYTCLFLVNTMTVEYIVLVNVSLTV